MSHRKPKTPEEFVLHALETLPKEGYRGFHAVYSGFNEAFRQWFPDSDPKEVTNRMAEKGLIKVVICKGGAMINPPDNKTENASPAGDQALRRMGLKK